jgi:hypothetical protein
VLALACASAAFVVAGLSCWCLHLAVERAEVPSTGAPVPVEPTESL